MAQVLKLKRTAVQGKVPNTSSLELGELAINTFDGKIYFEKDNGTPSVETILVTDSTTTGSINLIGAVSASYFKGDGSALTNLPNADVSQVATVTASFDNQSNINVVHNFDTRNILVSVYDTAYSQIIPSSVTLTNNNSVDITLSAAQSGFAVVAKGGHIVSGTLVQEVTEVATISASFDTQSTISVTHNFNSKNIIVSVYDSNDSQIIPSSVTLTDLDTTTIILSSPQSGYVVVAKGGHLVTATGTISYNNLADIPSGIISGSVSVPAGTISGSSQLTSSFDIRYTLSGSVQNIELPSNLVSGSSQLTSSLDGRYLQSGSSLSSDSITFNRTAGINVTEGQMAWNNSDGTLDIGLNYGDVVLQVGQEQHFVVRNSTGTTISNGTAVYASGLSAGSKRIEVSPFTANGTTDEVRFLGLATHNISDGVNGVVSNFGYVRGLDTRGTSTTAISVGDETWAEGDILYAHPTAAGKLTKVAPKNKITVAMVTTRHQTTGVLFVRPSSFGHIDDLHDVQINTGSLVTGSMLEWNGGYFVNNNTFSSSVDNRLDIIESTYATTGSNLFRGTQTHSGSIVPATDNTYDLGSPTYQWRDIYVSSGSLYIDGTKVLSSTNQELQITTDTGQSIKILEEGSDNIILQSVDGDIQLKSSGGGNLLFDPTSGLIDVRGTLQIQDGNKITSSGGTTIQFGNDLGITGSINTSGNVNGINLSTFSSSVASTFSNQNSATSSYARINSTNTFNGTQTISGSLLVTQDLIILGSSSIQNVSSSTLNIGTNIITVATNQPSVRFGGLAIIDSGSAGGSGSILYDSVEDEFVFLHRGNGINITSSHFLMGPETIDNLGNEIYLTNNRLPKGTGKEHLNDSNISDTGTLITLGSNSVVNGTLLATGTTLVSSSEQVVGILNSVNTYTSSQDNKNSTLATYTGSIDTKFTTLGTYTSSLETKNSTLATYTGSLETKNSTLATYTGSVNSQLSSLITATSSYETRGRGIVSGSSQITLSSTTGYGSVLNQAVLTTSSPTFGGITLNGESITSYTNAISTTNGLAGYGIHRVYANNSTVEAQIYAAADGVVQFGTYTNHNVYIKTNNINRVMVSTTGHVTPSANGTQDLGSATNRWSTVYTSDLSLNNGIGDWTIVEGEDDLFLYNNKKGKVYKFALTEVDPNVATPKKS
jgi:hypothetical protein